MSGIFKSVKKAFKKVGKLVKKILPVLIIAAAVYFGGAYLMSVGGGATAGAAGSAATSFTKSAGVWKSFLGGLANGNAGSSAAAYAEASYAAVGSKLSLAGQVTAGTNAVQSLGVTHNVASAVDVGLASGKAFDGVIASGGSSMDAALAGQNIVTDYSKTIVDPTGKVAGSFTPALEGQHALINADNSTVSNAGYGAMAPGEQPYQKASAGVQKASAGVQIATQPSAAPIKRIGNVKALSIDDLDPKDPNFANQLAALQYRTDQADSVQRHEQMMEMLGKSHQRNMMGLYMQGAGMLASAYGASQPTAEEKKDEARMNWKAPEGPRFDIVNPPNPQAAAGVAPELQKMYQSKGLLA